MSRFEEGTYLGELGLVDAEKMERNRQEYFRMVAEANKLISNPPKSVFVVVKSYRKLVQDMLQLFKLQFQMIEESAKAIDEIQGSSPALARRRWTEEEDELLVTKAAEEDSSVLSLALAFHRTPSAVSSRLTQLIGIGKISKTVVGRLVGHLEGEKVEGFFEGKLFKS